jgi:hypothetical protein
MDHSIEKLAFATFIQSVKQKTSHHSTSYSNSDYQNLQWLCTKNKKNICELTDKLYLKCTEYGSLDIIQWLSEISLLIKIE